MPGPALAELRGRWRQQDQPDVYAVVLSIEELVVMYRRFYPNGSTHLGWLRVGKFLQTFERE